MSKSVWHAFYYGSFEKDAPVVRRLIIEAANEDKAGKLATRQMGRCLRVHVTRPVWGASDGAGLTTIESKPNGETDDMVNLRAKRTAGTIEGQI